MAQQRRGQSKQVTKGPLHAVPCPYCGKKMDFRPHADATAGGTGWGATLETGAKVDCDNPKCGKTSKIHTIQKITVVKLVQSG